VDLKDLKDRAVAGQKLGPKERQLAADAAIAALGVEKAIKLLVCNKPYEEVMRISEEWSERLKVDRKLFLKAWRGESLEEPDIAP
jgi:hypothetical protein